MKSSQSLRSRVSRRNSVRKARRSLTRGFAPNSELLEPRQMLAADLVFDSHFDLDGNPETNDGTSFSFDSFDFSVGNALIKNFAGLQEGETGELLYQAQLANFVLDSDPVLQDGGLDTNYEITAVMRITVLMGATDPDLIDPVTGKTIPGGFALELAPIQLDTSFGLQLYYDDLTDGLNEKHKELTGAGFDDGEVILEAEIDDLEGIFEVSNIPGQNLTQTILYDQNGPDDYNLFQTVRSTGGIDALAETLTLNTGGTEFFTTRIGDLEPDDLALLDVNFNTNLPFLQVNPSRAFFAPPTNNPVVIPDNGPYNNDNTNGVGTDFQLQADGNIAFSLVPGSIHGFKFEDMDKSGDYVPEIDRPWAGFEFDLWKDVDENEVLNPEVDILLRTEVTDSTGEFWFEELAPGYYLVAEDIANAPAGPGDNIMPSTRLVESVLVCAREEHVWQDGAAMLGEIVGRKIFYNNSAFDGNNPAINADDNNAIDDSKVAYDGTGDSDFSNYTSYDKGINGIIVDIVNGGFHNPITSADFEFRVGNDQTPALWDFAPMPSVTTSAVNAVDGATRVYISWPDGTITNEWLMVKVKANINTRIAEDDVHYWGNKIAESGNLVENTAVNGLDVSSVVGNWSPTEDVGMYSDADFNRDNRVNGLDVSLVVGGWAPTPLSSIVILSDPIGPHINQWKRIEVWPPAGGEDEFGNNPELMWGNYVKGSIHGFKFEDFDGDGIYDPPGTPGGEHDGWDIPMGGISFRLTGVDGMGNPVGPLDVTANDEGEFWYVNLDPGVYQVQELPPSWPDSTMPSTPTVSREIVILSREEHVWTPGAAMLPSGSLRREILIDVPPVDPGTGGTGDTPVLEEPNSIDEGLIFGNYVKGSLHGFKYEDYNGNGVYDDGDAPWAGIRFELLDGTGEVVQGPIATNSQGEFWFNGLDPGYYQVREVVDSDGEIFPTVPADGLSPLLFVGSRQELVWADGAAMLPIGSLRHETNVGEALIFGDYVPGSIHGVKCEDLDADGSCFRIVEDGIVVDPPFPGVTIFLDGVDGMGREVHLTEVTNEFGEFWFEDLYPGTYTVAERSAPKGVNGETKVGLPDQGELLDAAGAIAFPTDNVMQSGENSFTTVLRSRQEFVWTDGAGHFQRYCFVGSSPGLVEVTGDITHVLCAGDEASHTIAFDVPMADDAYHATEIEFSGGPKDGGFATWTGGDFTYEPAGGSGAGVKFTARIVAGKVRDGYTVDNPNTGSLIPSQNYTNLALQNGAGVTGSGFTVNVSVNAEGRISSLTTNSQGQGYKSGDMLLLPFASIGGQTFADNVTITVNEVESMFVDLIPEQSGIDAIVDMGGKGYMVGDMFTITPDGSINGDVFAFTFAQGSGYDEGTYTDIATTADDPSVGSGLTVNVVVNADKVVSSVTVNQAGANYKVGDKVRVDGAILGAGADDDVVLTITEVGNDNVMFEVKNVGNTELFVELMVMDDIYGQVTSIDPPSYTFDSLTGGTASFAVGLTGAGINDSVLSIGAKVDGETYTGDLIVDGSDLDKNVVTIAINDGTLREQVPTTAELDGGVFAPLIFANYVKGSIHGIKYYDAEPLDGIVEGVPFPGIEFSPADSGGNLLIDDWTFDGANINDAPAGYTVYNGLGTGASALGGWSQVSNRAQASINKGETKAFSFVADTPFSAGIGFAVSVAGSNSTLAFYIDDVLKGTWAGTSGQDDAWFDGAEWGAHKYTFVFSKTDGDDTSTATVDNIRFTAISSDDSEILGEYWIEDIRPGSYTVQERLEYAGSFDGEVMPTFMNVSQYASGVVGFSSQYDVEDEAQDMLAIHALGGPDGRGWSPAHMDHEHGDPIPEYIEVSFGKPVYATSVDVVAPGGFESGVIAIYINSGDTWVQIPTDGVLLGMPDFLSNKVRVEINTDTVWNQFEKIDAIQLNGMMETKTEVGVNLQSGEELVWSDGAAMLPDGSLREESYVGGTLEFFDYIKGSIHGFKFEDMDGNGSYDPEVDRPWANFAFELFTKDVMGNYTVARGVQLSDTNGQFWFNGIKPGDYRLIELGENFNDEVKSSTATVVDLVVDSGEELVWTTGAAMLDPVDKPFFKEENNVGSLLQFGNYVTGSIHGFKFEDFDGDGAYDPADGDRPFGGIPFEIIGVEWNAGYHDTGVTTNEGEFWFTDLRPGPYLVRERLDLSWDNSVMPTNQTPWSGESGEYGSEALIFVKSRQELAWTAGAAMLSGPTLKEEVVVGEQLYFGNAVKGSIHGFKCEDVDADGLCETTGHVVIVIDASNTMTAEFVDLDMVADDPVPKENKLQGAVVAGKSLIDSIPGVPATAQVDIGIVVIRDGTAFAVDFGGSDFTTSKADAKAALDAIGAAGGSGDTSLEAGINQATAMLSAWDAEPHRANVYFLADGEVSNGQKEGDELQPNVDALAVYAGNIVADAIGADGELESLSVIDPDAGFLVDKNDVETYDVGADYEPPELPLAGVTFELDGATGTGIQVHQTVETDANGEFWFVDLMPGDYVVTEILPSGEWLSSTHSPADAPSYALTIGSREEFAWAPGAAMLPPVTLKVEILDNNLTFGNYVPGSIHGFKFHDINGNGMYDDGDAPLPGVTINLSGSVSAQAVTGLDGEYWFTGLRPGTYNVAEQVEVGLVPTTPISVDLTIESRQEYVWTDGAAMLPEDSDRYEVNVGEQLMFGNAILGSIHGFKFEDYDGDGAYIVEPNEVEISGEPGVDDDGDGNVDNFVIDENPDRPGVQNDEPWSGFFFMLKDLAGNNLKLAASNADGEFWFEELLPGTYVVEEIQPGGNIAPSTPTSTIIVVNSGEEHAWEEGRGNASRIQTEVVDASLAFGNYVQGSIHGCVFHDESLNGMFDSDETTQGGIPVLLLQGGEVIATDTSDVFGRFDFTGLAPGEYEVQATDSTIWVQTTTNEVKVGSREEYVHSDGAAGTLPGNQLEVNVGSRLDLGVAFVTTSLPAIAAAVAPVEASVTGSVVDRILDQEADGRRTRDRGVEILLDRSEGAVAIFDQALLDLVDEGDSEGITDGLFDEEESNEGVFIA